MTCHVLHAGDGYTYLTRQVASGDVARSAHDPLVAYYQVEGNPPGVWAGSGIAALGISGVVSEEHMAALFGEGLRPDAHEFIAARIADGVPFARAKEQARLGRRFAQYDNEVPLLAAIRTACTEFEAALRRRPTVEERRGLKESVARRMLSAADGSVPTVERVRAFLTDQLGKARQPVAGFDLVFTPVKSVSLLWALGGHEVRQVVEQVHEAAWRGALAYGERVAAFTRVGPGGIAQVATGGFVATAFTHRDSRAGDPNLHTHVTIANRILAADGKWRTVDSQQLHRVAVSMSETYNSLVEQGMVDRLGVEYTDTSRGAGKRVVREIAGIPVEWIRGFSRRRTQVEAGYHALVREYVNRYGRTPPRSVQLKLAQQATLQDRPDKTALRTLAEQIADWRHHAQQLLPRVDIDTTIRATLHRAVAQQSPKGGVDLAAVAARVVARVSQDRSTWTVFHLRAEAHRQLRPLAFATGADRVAAVDAVARLAIERECILLDIDLDPVPAVLRRPDGESVLRRHGAQRFTTTAILTAEQQLVTDARTHRGPTIAAPVRRAAVQRFEHHTGTQLNPGQHALVEHFTSSGLALTVAIGPPGSGKTTALRAVREVWAATSGRVIGLAPSATAATVLGDELGVPADTLHSFLIHQQHGSGQLNLQAGDMVLVDEAGMAATSTLAALRDLCARRGAVLRLIGDYLQLAAVEAGGALRLIHTDTGGVELTDLHRFTNPDEADALRRFRLGDPTAIGFYTTNQRLHDGPQPAVLDQLYRDWRNDTTHGRVSIMIADSNHIARELSTRAQTERRTHHLAEPHGVELHDGSEASVGDMIVTRHNLRRHTLFGGRDYVKNGDLWTVQHRHPDGHLRVQHLHHHGVTTLPAHYVAEWVELGYATTIHRAQGLTVHISRTYLTASTTRESALVALSRGSHLNHAYLDTEQILALDEPHTLPGDLYHRHRNTSRAYAALTAILRRESAEPSATEQLRTALDNMDNLAHLVPQYEYARQLYRGPDAAARAEQWLHTAFPSPTTNLDPREVVSDPAWPELADLLHHITDLGQNPVRVLREVAAQRLLRDDPVDSASSAVQVLHHRTSHRVAQMLTDTADHSGLPGWVTPPPVKTSEPDELGDWLRLIADRITSRVHHLGDRSEGDQPEWLKHLGPVPATAEPKAHWTVCVEQVAAYRERWGILGSTAELLPADAGGRRSLARTCVMTSLERPDPLDFNSQSTEQRSSRDRVSRLRHRLASIQEQLDTPTAQPSPTIGAATGTDMPSTDRDPDIEVEAGP